MSVAATTRPSLAVTIAASSPGPRTVYEDCGHPEVMRSMTPNSPTSATVEPGVPGSVRDPIVFLFSVCAEHGSTLRYLLTDR
jgi:hypothetical protein